MKYVELSVGDWVLLKDPASPRLIQKPMQIRAKAAYRLGLRLIEDGVVTEIPAVEATKVKYKVGSEAFGWVVWNKQLELLREKQQKTIRAQQAYKAKEMAAASEMLATKARLLDEYNQQMLAVLMSETKEYDNE